MAKRSKPGLPDTETFTFTRRELDEIVLPKLARALVGDPFESLMYDRIVKNEPHEERAERFRRYEEERR